MDRAMGVKPQLFIERDKWPRFLAKNYNEETEVNPYRAEMLARTVGAMKPLNETEEYWNSKHVKWHQKRLSDSSSFDPHPMDSDWVSDRRKEEARRQLAYHFEYPGIDYNLRNPNFRRQNGIDEEEYRERTYRREKGIDKEDYRP